MGGDGCSEGRKLKDTGRGGEERERKGLAVKNKWKSKQDELFCGK